MDGANNYYPEDESDEAANPAPESSPKEEYGEESALIPKALLAGKDFKPGDEVVFKIVHLYEDEVEVEYAKGDSKPKSAMDESMESMDKMATEEA